MSGTSFTSENWNDYAACYDALRALRPYQDLLLAVFDHLAPTPGDRVIDIGCGTGNLLERFHPCPNVAIAGIDGSASMLAHARRKLESQFPLLVQGDLGAPMPFQSGQFTKAACVNVLYAVPDPKVMLDEIHRILVPGGLLVLVTPKHGYDNGLVLKSHAGSSLPDTHWQQPHTSPEREEMLIREAIRDEKLVEQMLLIARYNREIAGTMAFNFFTEQALRSLVSSAGFSTHHLTSVYADQNWLAVLSRR